MFQDNIKLYRSNFLVKSPNDVVTFRFDIYIYFVNQQANNIKYLIIIRVLKCHKMSPIKTTVFLLFCEMCHINICKTCPVELLLDVSNPLTVVLIKQYSICH